ncbi:MAG: RHS repeat domain-containing protein [Thermoanaerobaculia bacterium]
MSTAHRTPRSRNPLLRVPQLLPLAFLVLATPTLLAINPMPPYSVYPCDVSTTNCNGGDAIDDLQVKITERSPRSTCGQTDTYGNCYSDFQGGSCPGSSQWCMSGLGPHLLGVTHSAASAGHIQLDVEYDWPNNYCQTWDPPSLWPNWYAQIMFLEVIPGGPVSVPVFEHGRWKPTVACSASPTTPQTFTIRATRWCGWWPEDVDVTYTITSCDSPQPPTPAPQNGNSCPNPAFADSPVGGAMGPGNVSIGRNGAPVLSESPVAGPLAPSFTYNGNDLADSAGLSAGWYFSYGETLVQDIPGRLVWTDATGFKRYFTGSDGAGYDASHPGEALGTVALVAGDYVLARPDGSTRTFVASSGFWKEATDRWGNGAQGNATSSSRATVVVELLGGVPTGRQISLGYTSGRLTSVTDAAAGVTQLGYDGSNRLSTICTADQACPATSPWRTYGYEGTTGRLTSITDAGGFVVRGYAWNTAGDVASTWIGATTYAAGKERATFTETGSTVLVSRYIDGTSTADTTYTVEEIAGVYRITEISGSCPECGAENSTSIFDATTGRRLTRTDGNGHTTVWTYDGDGNVTEIVEAQATAVSRTTTYVYAVPGVDPLPPTWPPTVRDFWKEKHDPSGVKPGSLVVTTRSFGGTGTLEMTETVAGHLAATDSSPTPRSSTTTFDASGRVLSVDGPRTDVSDVVTFEYYPPSEIDLARRHRLSRRVEADQTETTFDAYHALGGGTRETRKLRTGASTADVVTERAFDARGHLLSQTLKATSPAEKDIVTTTGYDTRGRVSFSQVQPAGESATTRTDLAYEDGTDRLLTRTLTMTPGGAGDRVTYGYDDRGNVTSERYGYFNGTSTTEDYAVDRAYDGQCRVKRQTYPADDATTAYTYDCVGNLTQVTDALHTTPNLLYGYDERNRLTSVTRVASPSNDVTTYVYDARDSLVQVTDPNGASTFYVFDDFGQLRRKTTALSGGGYGDVTTYAYDAAGNLFSESNAVRGTTRTWDAAGRLLTVTNASGSPTLSIVHTYDTGCGPDPVSGHIFGQGRPCTVVDESGTTTFAYDRRGLVVSQSVVGSTASETGTLAYRHDATGREVEVTYPSTDKIQSVRDAAGRVTTLTWVPPVGSPTTILSSITHKPFGPVTGFVTSGGATETRSYDTRYRRLSQSTVSGGVTRLSLTYDAWDKEGNLLYLRDTTPGSGTAFDRTFGYDPDRYFLTSSSGPYGTSWAQQSLTWTYDPNGNRLTESRSTVGTTTYSYGNDGATHSNGVLASVTPPGGTPASVSSLSTGDMNGDDDNLLHEYDALGRLTRVTGPLGNGCFPRRAVATFKHDARNLRTLASYIPCGLVSPAVQAEFAFHGPDGTLLFLRESQPVFVLSTDQVHVWLDGEPVALIARGTSKMNRFERLTFLHGDHLGRPVGMTDSTGALVWRPEYEPFGRSLAPRTNTIPGPGFRFPGQWESRISADLPGGDPTPLGRIGALTDNWHRTYVQRWGRYTQPDPIGLQGGINLFGYVGGRPTVAADPSGLDAVMSGGVSQTLFMGSCAIRVFSEARRRGQQAGVGWGWAHCWASCKLTKECGGPQFAWAFGFGKEVADFAKCSAIAMMGGGTFSGACESAFQPSDFADNKTGRTCPSNTPCEDRCAPLAGRDSTPGPFFGSGMGWPR